VEDARDLLSTWIAAEAIYEIYSGLKMLPPDFPACFPTIAPSGLTGRPQALNAGLICALSL